VNRILIIQTAFLGDVILATPVISELNRIFPQSEIDVLVKKGNESLLTGNPKIHEVFVLDKSSGKWKAIRSLIRTFRKNNYDLIINLHRFGSSGLIATRSKAKLVYGFSKNPFSFLYSKKFTHAIGDGTHEVERNLSVIAEFGAKSLVRPELFPSSDDYDHVKEYGLSPYVCLAPASVWFTKQLPEEKWKELIQQIKDKQVILLGGKDDFDLCERIKASTQNENIINLAGQLSLLQSAALMKNAVHAYVNDSGPLHIASAMNVPTTAFFCSTVPSFGFGPLAETSEVREVEGLDCKPCGLHGHKSCPKGNYRCGNEMNVRI